MVHRKVVDGALDRRIVESIQTSATSFFSLVDSDLEHSFKKKKTFFHSRYFISKVIA